MAITVTIYNDDAHGRLFQVIQVNTRTGAAFRREVIEQSEGNGPVQFALTEDEILIVATAEPSRETRSDD
jgi:hypothetical protein